MSLIDRLFGQQATPQERPSQLHAAPSTQAPADHNATRRELLRVVLRDTLARHGVPLAWIASELLTAASRNRELGLHLRLQIRHWEPRLLPFLVALEDEIASRAASYDPHAHEWLMGVSWQFAVPDRSACPPLPPAASWKSPPPSPQPVDVLAMGDARAKAQEALAAGDRAAQAAPAPDFMKTQVLPARGAGPG